MQSKHCHDAVSRYLGTRVYFCARRLGNRGKLLPVTTCSARIPFDVGKVNNERDHRLMVANATPDILPRRILYLRFVAGNYRF